MHLSDCHLGFIGFGSMAQILFKMVTLAKLVSPSKINFIQRDAHKMRENEAKFGLTSTSLKTLAEKSDLLLLCVKPQQAEKVLLDLKALQLDPSKMIISILAGVKHSYYRKFLKNPLLRSIPNIASEVFMGMTLLSPGPNASAELQSLGKMLFSCMGEVMQVPEELMDISSAIAGSGPAFVFRLIESAAKAGTKEGLSYEDALKLAAQAFMGAGKLVLKSGDIQTLISKIATPKGTTEAGLKTMDHLELSKQFQEVFLASTMRSKELSQEFH